MSSVRDRCALVGAAIRAAALAKVPRRTLSAVAAASIATALGQCKEEAAPAEPAAGPAGTHALRGVAAERRSPESVRAARAAARRRRKAAKRARAVVASAEDVSMSTPAAVPPPGAGDLGQPAGTAETNLEVVEVDGQLAHPGQAVPSGSSSARPLAVPAAAGLARAGGAGPALMPVEAFPHPVFVAAAGRGRGAAGADSAAADVGVGARVLLGEGTAHPGSAGVVREVLGDTVKVFVAKRASHTGKSCTVSVARVDLVVLP